MKIVILKCTLLTLLTGCVPAIVSNNIFSFHAKVVDQYGNTVSDVKVPINHSYYHFLSIGLDGPIRKKYIETTDENGEISVFGRAETFRIGELKKPGYIFEFVGSFQTRHAGGRYMPNTNSNHPYIIHAYKKGNPTKLIEGDYGYKVKPDGRVYTVDFEKRGGRQLIEGEDKGHILVTFNQSQSSTIRIPIYDVLIESINGGIMESHDYFMFEAPEEGYKSQWNIHVKKHSIEKEHKLYMKSNNGKEYGRLIIELVPHVTGGMAAFRFDYRINTNGSRNLLSEKD